MQKYTKLKAGDIRQNQDQFKSTNGGVHPQFPEDCKGKDWTITRLSGHKILPADLVVAEYRRPV